MIAIFGGTGSFGQAYVKYLLQSGYDGRIAVFSRDEAKHYWMQKEICSDRVEYVIGDISDRNAVDDFFRMRGIRYVIHAAAMKHVPACEDNPWQAIRTNVEGTNNIARCCLKYPVDKAIFLSTDKAVEPANMYGVTKAAAERLWLNYAGTSRVTDFIVSRYGNVVDSKGAVLEYWKRLHENGENLKITDVDMTRFWLKMGDAVKFVHSILEDDYGSGVIVIPMMKAFFLTDLAMAISQCSRVNVIGVRPGEKIHEKIISDYEIGHAVFHEKHIVIYKDAVLNRVSYDSGSSKDAIKMTINEIRNLL